MVQTHKSLLRKLFDLEMLSEEGSPVKYSIFKNRASVHRYGVGSKIVFLGEPNKNLFGFYVSLNTDTAVMKNAYKMYLRLVKGNLAEFEALNVQWGNCALPTSYVDLKIN